MYIATSELSKYSRFDTKFSLFYEDESYYQITLYPKIDKWHHLFLRSPIKLKFAVEKNGNALTQTTSCASFENTLKEYFKDN